MGPETSQPDVEETTEPPICSSTYEEPPSILQPTIDPIVSVEQQPHCVHRDQDEKSTPTPAAGPHEPLSAPSSVPAGDCQWTDQYQYAHTFAASDIARVLNVDLQ